MQRSPIFIYFCWIAIKSGVDDNLNLFVTSFFVPNLLLFFSLTKVFSRFGIFNVIFYSTLFKFISLLGFLIFMLMGHDGNFIHLVILSFLCGVSSSFYNPAMMSIPPLIEDDTGRQKINSTLSVSLSLSTVVAAAFSALFISFFRIESLNVYIVLTLVSFICVLLNFYALKGYETKNLPVNNRVFELSPLVIKKYPDLTLVVSFIFLIGAFFLPIQYYIPAKVALHATDQSGFILSLLEIGIGLGSFCGSLVILACGNYKDNIKIVPLFFCITSVSYVFFGFFDNVFSLLISLFLIGFFLVVCNILSLSFYQKRAECNHLPAVMYIVNLSSVSVTPLAIWIGGNCAGRFGLDKAIYISSISMFFVSLLMLIIIIFKEKMLISKINRFLQRRYILLSVLVCVAFSSCSSENDTVDITDLAMNLPVNIDGKVKFMSLKSAMSYYNVPGVSYAIIDNNNIVEANAVGYTSADKHRNVDLNTLFQAGSLSKSVAAISAVKMVDLKLIDLDSDITPFLGSLRLPNPHNFSQKITLSNLLSMSSGLNIGGFYGYLPKDSLPTSIQIIKGDFPAMNAPVIIKNKPGNSYDYSGGGYQVVQLLLENIMNMSVEKYSQEYIFSKLQMNHSSYLQPADVNVAHATSNTGKAFDYKWRVLPELFSSGLWSTPSDLSRLIISINKAYSNTPNQIISPKMAHEVLTKQVNTPYGLGFVVKGSDKTLHYMKLGQNAGYQGWLIGLPNTKQGAVVMTNSDNGRELAQSLVYSIAKDNNWPIEGTLLDAWMVE